MIVDMTETKKIESEQPKYHYDCKCKECRKLPPEITFEPTPNGYRSWTSWWVAPHLCNLPSSKRPPNYNRYLQSHLMKQKQAGRYLDAEMILEIDWLAAGESDD